MAGSGWRKHLTNTAEGFRGVVKPGNAARIWADGADGAGGADVQAVRSRPYT